MMPKIASSELDVVGLGDIVSSSRLQDVQPRNNRNRRNGSFSRSPAPPEEVLIPTLRKSRTIILIAALTGIDFVSSVSDGLVTIGLPQMGVDIGLPANLLLWPSSVYSLTSGSILLLAGSVADVLGSRVINLTGCFGLACFIAACGLARTGVELIVFRAMQGIAVSLCLPTSMAIIANNIARGRRRNVGFACLGIGKTLGYSVGLVAGGVFVDTIGWRAGYCICGAVALVLSFISIWALPPDRRTEAPTFKKLKNDVDWVGALIASSCLALVSYVLA